MSAILLSKVGRMNDLWEWFAAVLSHWQGWLSGSGIGGLILLLLYGIERLHPKGWTVPKKWYAVILGAFFVLGASYTSWKDERSAKVEAEKKLEQLTIPNLDGEFNSFFLAPVQGKIVVSLEVTIKNTGAPSIADSFELDLQIDGKNYRSFPIPHPEGDLTLFVGSDTSEGVRFHTQDYLPTKAISAPILTGGATWGYAQFMYSGITKEQARSANAVLSFKDIRGRTYSISKNIGKLSNTDLPDLRGLVSPNPPTGKGRK